MQLKYYLTLSMLPLVGAYLSSDRDQFMSDFLDRFEKPGYVSLITDKIQHATVRLGKHLHRSGIFLEVMKIYDSKNLANCFQMKSCNLDDIDSVENENYDNVVYLADLREVHRNVLKADNINLLVDPARWILLYEVKSKKPEEEIELLLADAYVAVNTEVYVVLMYTEHFHIFLVYKRHPNLPFIWENYSKWNKSKGFDRAHPTVALALRRKSQNKMDVRATAVIIGNDSLANMPNYQQRHVNLLTKINYWMTVHLFEWLNATGHIDVIKSDEKLKHNGTLEGIAKELYYGHSEFSASLLVPIKENLPAITYIASPAATDAYVILKKPSLASVGNIYTLPFSIGVWIALALLIVLSSITLCFTSIREEVLLNRQGTATLTQRISQGFHDTLCLVFQQGTANDPASISSREILFLGLLSFMFLFTAYSANIVALLQSVTNDIDSVESLVNSPLMCGAEDTEFNRVMFEEEDRPVYRSFWLKKAVPQGDQFFLSVEEGIRRMREGMYAFVVDPTAGNDEIKATFYELEKCNIGTFKYTESIRPHVGVARHSRIKEILRIGVLRIIETGVQSRSSRRVLSSIPPCGVGTAMFTAVSLTHVAPAYKWIATLYAIAVGVLVVEIVVDRRGWL